MLALAELFDWRPERAILYGFVLALSSTAVGIKILEDVGELRNETGRVAVGVLIAQDLAVVPMLIVIGGMAQPAGRRPAGAAAQARARGRRAGAADLGAQPAPADPSAVPPPLGAPCRTSPRSARSRCA